MLKNYFKSGMMLLAASAIAASASAGDFVDVSRKYMKDLNWYTSGWQGYVGNVANGVGEVWGGAFDCYQYIDELPAGQYTLSVDAFYRCADNDYAKANMAGNADLNTCFIYAGKFSELSMDRHPYKIYLHFNAIDDNHGTITMDAEDPDINFVQNKVARYQIVWAQDEVQDFLKYYNVIITDIDYNFDDITTSPGRIITYNVRGGMTMQRRLNMQKPVEDQIEF